MILQGLIPSDPGVLSTTQILAQGNSILAGFVTQAIATGRGLAATQLQQEGNFLQERARVEALAESSRQFGIQTEQRDREFGLREREFAESVARDRRNFAATEKERAASAARADRALAVDESRQAINTAEFGLRVSEIQEGRSRLDRLLQAESAAGTAAPVAAPETRFVADPLGPGDGVNIPVPGFGSAVIPPRAGPSLPPGTVNTSTPLGAALQERQRRQAEISGAPISSLTSGLFSGQLTPEEALAESDRRISVASQNAARAEAIRSAAAGVGGASAGDALLTANRLRADAVAQADQAERLRLSAEGLLSGKLRPQGALQGARASAAASPELNAEVDARAAARAQDTVDILGAKEERLVAEGKTLSSPESKSLLDAQLTLKEAQRATDAAKAAATPAPGVAGNSAAPAPERRGYAPAEPPPGATGEQKAAFQAEQSQRATVLDEVVRVAAALKLPVRDVIAGLLKNTNEYGIQIDGAGVGSTLLNYREPPAALFGPEKTGDILRDRASSATNAANNRKSFGAGIGSGDLYSLKGDTEKILKDLIAKGPETAYLWDRLGPIGELDALQAAGVVKGATPVAPRSDRGTEAANRVAA